jgi:hypothetical protein
MRESAMSACLPALAIAVQEITALEQQVSRFVEQARAA